MFFADRVTFIYPPEWSSETGIPSISKTGVSLHSDGTRSVRQFVDGGTNYITLSDLPTNAANIRIFLNTRHGLGWSSATYSMTSQSLLENTALTSHSDGDTLLSDGNLFTWQNVEADEYRVIIRDLSNTTIYNQFFTEGTFETTVDNLPTNGQAVRLLLKTRHGTGWHTRDYYFNTQEVQSPSQLTSHKDQDRLNSQEVTFTWSDAEADEYRLVILSNGTVLQDKRYSWDTLSDTVSNLPLNSGSISLELYTRHGRYWAIHYYLFNTPAAVLISHERTDTLSQSTTTFRWSDTNAEEYRLIVTRNEAALYDQYFANNVLNTVIEGLPMDGLELIFTLATRQNGVWLEHDYEFKTLNLEQSARLTSHQSGDQLDSEMTTFTWVSENADAHQLIITNEGVDIVDQLFSGEVFSANIGNLPINGTELSLLLRTRYDNTWLEQRYFFSTRALLNNATFINYQHGDQWESDTVTFNWTDVGADQYQIIIQSDGTRSYSQLYDGNTSYATLNNLPRNGANMRVFLNTLHGTEWLEETYSFVSQAVLENTALTSHRTGNILSGDSVVLTWEDVNADEYRVIVQSNTQRTHNEFYGGDVLTANISDWPTNEETVRVLLKTRHGGGWFTRVYTLDHGD